MKITIFARCRIIDMFQSGIVCHLDHLDLADYDDEVDFSFHSQSIDIASQIQHTI